MNKDEATETAGATDLAGQVERRVVRALDLFCGACGGWSVGLHRAGFVTVAACELDEWRREKFSQNFPAAKMYGDIRELTAERLKQDGIQVDIVVGSPPCQDASSANAKGKGVDGKRTGLFFEAVRLVGELRPDWAAFENVPGLRTRGYDRVHDALERAGYEVRPLVVGAWHAGAPHRRNRVWIVANAKENGRRSRGPGRSDSVASGKLEQALSRPDAAVLQRPAVTRDKPDGNNASFWNKEYWHGGTTRHRGMDDGLPKGLAQPLLSSYGDAVVPTIPELLGRAILSAYN